ncbi:hypothetical protein Hanom_Chr17g01550761 [Helianthus anomalus]
MFVVMNTPSRTRTCFRTSCFYRVGLILVVSAILLYPFNEIVKIFMRAPSFTNATCNLFFNIQRLHSECFITEQRLHLTLYFSSSNDTCFIFF